MTPPEGTSSDMDSAEAVGRRLFHSLDDTETLIATFTVVVVAGFGVLLTYVVVRAIGIQGDPVAVTCLLLPLVATLILTDRLSEISAGGVTAKFRKAGRQPVRPLVASVQEAVLPLSKGALSDLNEWLNRHAGNCR